MSKKIANRKIKFLHRGRIQAQGEKLEESESWAKNESLFEKEGYKLVDKLKNKISPFEAKRREKQFNNVKKFIKRAAMNGGIEVINKFFSKKFPVKKHKIRTC